MHQANPQHAVAYLAEAPKSTRSYTAYNRAEALATANPLPAPPIQIRNAPTKLMKQLGYGRDYAYNPDYAHPVSNEYLPAHLRDKTSLVPSPTTDSILRTTAVEADTKRWDEEKLRIWEEECNGGAPWPGRAVRDARLMRGERVHAEVPRHNVTKIEAQEPKQEERNTVDLERY